MDVIEAIAKRHSVRDFSPKPVPKETVMKILESATRSPSGSNSQPWEIFVAAGNTMGKIRAIYQERSKNAPAAPNRPASHPQPAYIQDRMNTVRIERLKLLGLDPNDPASGKVMAEWPSKLFGAPVLVVVCMDKALSSLLDIGLFVQTVCLAAQGYGVDSIIAGSSMSQPDVLRKELEIPDNLNLVAGILLGYANPDSVINTYRSPRRPIQEVVRYKS